MKVYLCGITQNQKKNIDDLTRDCYKAFDGLIYVDGGSTDGTKELLEERKGCGQVIYRRWTNDHDFQMNEFLRQGPLEIGDWFVLRDSRERFNAEWVAGIKDLIRKAKQSNIKSIYNYGKGFAFEYYDDMYFHGSPHWGLIGARSQAVDLCRNVRGGGGQRNAQVPVCGASAGSCYKLPVQHAHHKSVGA